MTEQTECANCGRTNPLGMNWCSNCGTNIAGQSGFQESAFGSSPSPTPALAATPQAVMTCAQHPTVQAAHKCVSCGAAVCSTCDFVMPRPDSGNILQISGDTHLCPNCVTARNSGQMRLSSPSVPASPVLPLPGGVMCARHMEVAAVRRCALCSSPMCQTCDFQLPGHFHVCPECATKPQTELSPTRKRNLIISYALAIWATLALAILFSGALADVITSERDVEVLSMAMHLLIFIPSLVGTALSLSCFDRKLNNPPAIWVAVGWNGLIAIGLLLLTVIGALSG